MADNRLESARGIHATLPLQSWTIVSGDSKQDALRQLPPRALCVETPTIGEAWITESAHMHNEQQLERSRQPEVPPFVTFWRALLAYIAAMSCAAAAFFPWLHITYAIRGEYMTLLRPALLSADGARHFLTIELGAVVAALVFASVWTLPMYIVGMALMRLFGVRRWIYFVALGIVLVVAFPYVVSVPRMPFALLRIKNIDFWFAIYNIPIGLIGGVVCWLVLRATFRKTSKQPNFHG